MTLRAAVRSRLSHITRTTRCSWSRSSMRISSPASFAWNVIPRSALLDCARVLVRLGQLPAQPCVLAVQVLDLALRFELVH